MLLVRLCVRHSRAGAVVLEAGERVGVAEVGILATVGAAKLPVHRRPKLAVLSTGDEVVNPATETLGPGQIRDCNRSMLLAAATAAGAEAIDLGIAKDVEGHLEGCLDRAIAAGVDVLVTSGELYCYPLFGGPDGSEQAVLCAAFVVVVVVVRERDRETVTETQTHTDREREWGEWCI